MLDMRDARPTWEDVTFAIIYASVDVVPLFRSLEGMVGLGMGHREVRAD
jgi:hypothetical protein